MIECPICKSRNQDESIYCSECGQRLHPADNSSLKLHSPLLDDRTSQQHLPAANQTRTGLANSQAPVNNARPGPSPQNGLHSPLLDAWNTNPLPAPQSDTRPTANKSSRLHSPVLDGPEQGVREFEPEDLDMPAEEYNSLRSPLLAAKVPLPEGIKPPAEPGSVQPPANPVPYQQPTIQSLFSSGVGSQKSPTEESYQQFASSLFDQSPTDTGDKPAVRSPRQTGHFTKVTGLKKEDKTLDSLSAAQPVDKTKNISGRQALLPKQEEFPAQQLPAGGAFMSGLFKILAALLLLAALGFKFWYWQTLGAALGSSQAFLCDQIGQILVILLLLILILTVKL